MPRKIKDSGVSWIGQIPYNWEMTRFKYTHTVPNVGDPIGKEYWSDDLSDTVFYSAGANYTHTSYDMFPESKYTNGNDLLLARNGTPYVYIPIDGACYSDHIIRVGIKEKYDRRFIGYILQESIKHVNVDIVSIPTWSVPVWNGQRLCSPPFEEQKLIADYLDYKCSEIDSIATDIQKEIETLEAYKKSIITEAVTKGINANVEFNKSSIDGVQEIPSHWTESKLNYEAYVRARLGWKGLKAEEYVEEGYAFISAFNIQNNKLVWEPLNYITKERYDESPEIKIKVGDVLLVKDGAGVGKSARVDSMPCGESSPNSSIGVITPYSNLEYRYLEYYLSSTVFSDFVLRLYNGMGIPHLTQEILKTLRLPLPPIEEQTEISDFLDSKCSEIDSIISSKKQQLDILASYKKSLIYEYVTGKKEVT